MTSGPRLAGPRRRPGSRATFAEPPDARHGPRSGATRPSGHRAAAGRGRAAGRCRGAAWLEIDLDALRGNLAVVRELAGPGVPVRPVVKADAYGHGAVPIALALEAAGADGFCVAAFDEALELREGGVSGPILVLYPVPAAWAAEAARAGIAVTVGDERGVSSLLAARAAGLDGTRPLSVELEVETGLGRGGFAEADLVAAARALAAAPGIALTGLWTHLQAVEDVANTVAQLDRFEAAIRALGGGGHRSPAPPCSPRAAGCSPSRRGLRRRPAGPGDLRARPRRARPDRRRPRPPRPGCARSCRSIARPVRVADLPAGWGISYGPTFTTERPSRIATLPFGYGDGWSRQLSNRAEALVRGRRVPLVGNVAMDAVMADVTDVPGLPGRRRRRVRPDRAQGDERSRPTEVARLRTTNTWEVVTAMARRVPRVYHAAAGPVGLRTLTER